MFVLIPSVREFVSSSFSKFTLVIVTETSLLGLCEEDEEAVPVLSEIHSSMAFQRITVLVLRWSAK